MKEIRFAVRVLIALVAVILASFAVNPAFLYGYEWVGRVSTLVVCAELLVAFWVGAEIVFATIIAAQAAWEIVTERAAIVFRRTTRCDP